MKFLSRFSLAPRWSSSTNYRERGETRARGKRSHKAWAKHKKVFLGLISHIGVRPEVREEKLSFKWFSTGLEECSFVRRMEVIVSGLCCFAFFLPRFVDMTRSFFFLFFATRTHTHRDHLIGWRCKSLFRSRCDSPRQLHSRHQLARERKPASEGRLSEHSRPEAEPEKPFWWGGMGWERFFISPLGRASSI